MSTLPIPLPPPTRHSLLGLPRELRDEVCGQVLCTPLQLRDPQQKVPHHPIIMLATTCRPLASEILDVPSTLLRRGHFIIHVYDDPLAGASHSKAPIRNHFLVHRHILTAASSIELRIHLSAVNHMAVVRSRIIHFSGLGRVFAWPSFSALNNALSPARSFIRAKVRVRVEWANLFPAVHAAEFSPGSQQHSARTAWRLGDVEFPRVHHAKVNLHSKYLAWTAVDIYFSVLCGPYFATLRSTLKEDIPHLCDSNISIAGELLPHAPLQVKVINHARKIVEWTLKESPYEYKEMLESHRSLDTVAGVEHIIARGHVLFDRRYGFFMTKS